MGTKKGRLYTLCIFIPVLLVIGYRYTGYSLFLDASMTASAIGMCVVAYKESPSSNKGDKSKNTYN